MTDVTQDIKAKLGGVSTATLTTALFKRGLRNQFIQNVHPLNPALPTMVGEVFTLRYIPAREDRNGLQVFSNPHHPQREAVETCPAGAVLIIDSRKDARAASAGSILVQRLQQRGVAGIVTDGGFRDSPEISSMRIAAYHARPAAPTNLVLHEAIEINGPIACGDVAVFPGDVAVGDAEGVVIVPRHLAAELAQEAVEMTRFETFVMERVREGATIIGLYPPTNPANVEAYEQWKNAGQAS